MWKIDIACRDTWGLLARLTGVLSDAGLDVTYASLTTWPDGAVLDSFIVTREGSAEGARPRPRDGGRTAQAAAEASAIRTASS